MLFLGEGRKEGGTLLLVCACSKQDPTALTHRSRLAQTRGTKQQLGWAPQPTAAAQSSFLGLGAPVGAQSHSFVLTGGSCQACRTGEDMSLTDLRFCSCLSSRSHSSNEHLPSLQNLGALRQVQSKGSSAQPRGLEQIFGSLLPFRVLSATGVEVSAHQLIPWVGF